MRRIQPPADPWTVITSGVRKKSRLTPDLDTQNISRYCCLGTQVPTWDQVGPSYPRGHPRCAMSSSSGATPSDLGPFSGSAAENHAKSNTPSASAPLDKPRSCAICRRRKVRCDKLSPCSNCRRANIPCVFPSTTDRPPRWARRLERLPSHHHNDNSPSAGDASAAQVHVMERLRTLESLVRDLSGQLEQANAVASVAGSGAASVAASPGSTTNAPSIRATAAAHKDVGRLLVRDANASRSRYVSSGFWSRIHVSLQVVPCPLGSCTSKC